MKLNMKNLFPKAQGVLKKVTAVTLCLVLVGLCLSAAGCIKQKNCEEGRTGTFIYLNKPYKTGTDFCQLNVKITAHFIDDEYSIILPIAGYVPRIFQTNDSIRARVCLNEFCPNDGKIRTADIKKAIYSLNGIEKED